jgi:hypothetical protein
VLFFNFQSIYNYRGITIKGQCQKSGHVVPCIGLGLGLGLATGTRSCGDIKTESLGLSSSRITTLPVVFSVFYQVFAVFYQVFFHIPVRYKCF